MVEGDSLEGGMFREEAKEMGILAGAEWALTVWEAVWNGKLRWSGAGYCGSESTANGK